MKESADRDHTHSISGSVSGAADELLPGASRYLGMGEYGIWNGFYWDPVWQVSSAMDPIVPETVVVHRPQYWNPGIVPALLFGQDK